MKGIGVLRVLCGFLLIGLAAHGGAFAKKLDVDESAIDLCKKVAVASSQFMDMRQSGATLDEVSDGIELESAVGVIKRAFSRPVEQTNAEKLLASAQFGADIIIECLEDPSRFYR